MTEQRSHTVTHRVYKTTNTFGVFIYNKCVATAKCVATMADTKWSRHGMLQIEDNNVHY